MKKLFLLLMITAVVLTGCKKNEAPTADQAKGEVEFNITNIMDEGSRTEIPGIPDCDLDAIPSHAIVGITTDIAGANAIPGSPFTMNISEVGSELLTDVLKLAPGTYYVTQFNVYEGTNLIWAAPAAGSFYNDFMNIKLNLEFTVVAYQKSGFEVEVLCYEETVADQFGFTWFDIDKVVLRDICLFGDICLTQFPGVTNWGDGGYSGEFDMPAQFQVTLYRAGSTVPLSVYQNYDPTNTATYVDTWTVPMALCIQYPDALEIPNEAFELVLEVYQPDGSGGFALYEWNTFTWEDNAAFIDLAETTTNTELFGDDNVIDFYVGDCFNTGTQPDIFFLMPTPPCYNQGFEVDKDGWNDGGGYGTVTRVTSGTNSITSYEGNWHATFEGDGGPYSWYCGASDTWPGTWYVESYIYIDLNWADDTGFDLSMAAANQGGSHLRDFIWHVGQVNNPTAGVDGLLVNASNNTDATFNDYKLINENGGNYFTILSSGWYKFVTEFTAAGVAGSEVLTVNFKLYNSTGTLLHTNTRSSPADLISTVVGGSYYGWFTYINVSGGIAVDETNMYRP